MIQIKKQTTSSIKKASLITATTRYSSVIFNLVFTMVLARILTPQEFGIVAAATVFTTFFQMVADMGLSTGLIQNKEINEDDIEDIYSINRYISFSISALFVPFSFVLVWFFDNEIFLTIGMLLALNLLFSSLASIPQALFARSRRFVLVGLVGLISNIVGGVFAIVFAISGFGCYAIVLQSLITSLAAFVWLDLKARNEFHVRFILRPKRNGLNKILKFSANQLGFNVVNYFARNLDNLLIGKVMGAGALGYYDKAYKLTTYPLNFLTYIISSTILPILSEFQTDLAYIYKRYIPIVRFLSLAGVYIAGVFYFAAEEVILLFYGDAWGNSIEPFRLLSLSVWFQMTVSSAGSIYQCAGRTDTMLRSCLVFVPIQVACIAAGAFSGSLDICAGCVAASFIIKFFVDYWFLIVRCLRFSLLGFLREFIPDLLIAATLVTAELVLGVSGILANVPIPISLIVKLFVATIAFYIGIRVTKQGELIVGFLPKRLAERIGGILGVKKNGE